MDNGHLVVFHTILPIIVHIFNRYKNLVLKGNTDVKSSYFQGN